MAETLERLIREKDLAVDVELTGAFCMERCSMGVSVRVGESVYSGVTPEGAEEFFHNKVLPQVAASASS